MSDVKFRTSRMAKFLLALERQGGCFEEQIPEEYMDVANEAAERGYVWRFWAVNDDGICSLFFTTDDASARYMLEELQHPTKEEQEGGEQNG